MMPPLIEFAQCMQCNVIGRLPQEHLYTFCVLLCLADHLLNLLNNRLFVDIMLPIMQLNLKGFKLESYSKCGSQVVPLLLES